MNYLEDLSRNIDSRTFSVESPTELQILLRSLQGDGNIKGVGFDVFGTVTTSLYSRTEQSLLLAGKVTDYYMSQTGKQSSTEQCLDYYNICRDNIRNNRKYLQIQGVEITQKQQECREIDVVASVGTMLGLDDISGLTNYVEQEWLKFDLTSTQPIQGMFDVIASSVRMFGKEHVGLYSNNSCSSSHLLTILEHVGYLSDQLIDSNNVYVSSEFGMKEYGVGLRKPNELAFDGFARKLGLDPGQIAFAGDGGNDVLFATESGGVGIRIP